MSQFNTSGHKGFVATAALGEGVLVKLSSGQVVVSTAATDKSVGVTTHSCEAGEVVDVRLLSAQGTTKFKAGGNVAVGDLLASDADGEVVATTTATHRVVGQALEAGVDNQMIEALTCNFVL